MIHTLPPFPQPARVDETFSLLDARQSSPEPRKPLDHQKIAIRKGLAHFETHSRGQLISACGTGKTLSQYWISEGLDARTTCCFEPSLALVAQTIKEWRAQAPSGTQFLAVCSDRSVVGINQDEVHVAREDLEADVTSDPHRIKEFLDHPGKRIVVSTLHSSPLVSEGMHYGRRAKFDFMTIDEAHRIATIQSSERTTPLDNELIPAKRRLFTTATPRIYEGDGVNEIVFSMDSKATFGSVFHRLSFGDAIEKKLLCDYRVIAATIKESELAEYERRGLTRKEGREALSMMMLIRAAEQHGIRRALTFHCSINRAQRYASELNAAQRRWNYDLPVEGYAVWGTQPSAVRTAILDRLRTAPNDVLSVVSNCRCLAEGADLPALDAVELVDPVGDQDSLIQILGRVVRKTEGKQFGYLIVPLIIPDSADLKVDLEASVFAPLAKVTRAIRAHDERLSSRCEILSDKEVYDRAADWFSVMGSKIPEHLMKQISTRVVMAGMGLSKPRLSYALLETWGRAHLQAHGELPHQKSGPVDGQENESWPAIQINLVSGGRGFRGGDSLVKFWERLGLRNPKKSYSNAEILRFAQAYRETHGGKLPNSLSGEVAGESGLTWQHLDARLRHRGTSLAKLFVANGLREEKGALSLNLVKTMIRTHIQLTGNVPTTIGGEVAGYPGENWTAINAALKHGHRGLPKGGSLVQVLNSMGIKPGRKYRKMGKEISKGES